MVTINLTLFVELGLFLVFLFAMKIFVFAPILRVMDARDAKITGDREAAMTGQEEAVRIEKKYAAAVAAAHRAESYGLVKAHRESQQAHAKRVKELKAEEDVKLAEIHAALMGQIEVERAHYPGLTAQLAQDMGMRLGLEDGGS